MNKLRNINNYLLIYIIYVLAIVRHYVNKGTEHVSCNDLLLYCLGVCGYMGIRLW